MKKFIAFAWYNYSAQGGMNDCIGFFDTIEEASCKITECDDDFGYLFNYGQILNVETMEVIFDWKS